MAYAEIDIKRLRNERDAILEHIEGDLGTRQVPVEEDQYWDVPELELYDLSKDPASPVVGSHVDDIDFSKAVKRGQSYDNPYVLVHIWPQLRYVAEKLKSR
jgi:hypothetical protein